MKETWFARSCTANHQEFEEEVWADGAKFKETHAERKIDMKRWNPKNITIMGREQTQTDTEQWVTTVMDNSYIVLTTYQAQF